MQHDAKERNKWKVRIADCINQSTSLTSRPVRKVMAEVVAGILGSGSLQMSEIGRCLKEPTRLHHTMKRLSRMLGKHSEVAWAAEALLLNQIAPKITDNMILAIDPGDLNRAGSTKSEGLCRVRDGDKGDIVNGYPLISVVARCLSTGATLPLLTRLLSSNRGAYKSENRDIMNTMERVQRSLDSKPLWVIDRGGDRSKLWDFWLQGEWRILVRATNQRFWNWRNTIGTAQQIAKQLPLKHHGKLKPNSKESIRFGITTVFLKEQPDTPLSMIVVRHGKQQPLVLVSTQRVRGRLQGERLIQAYISRWAVEEGFRFSKQGFDLEKVQARKLSTLQNLVALATLAWGLLADHQHQGNVLIDKAKRQKDHTPLTFPFYTLQTGWQELFAHATTLFYDWWRKPKPKDPPIIADLFENAGGLSPC